MKYALRMLSKHGRVYMTADGENIYFTTSREEIENIQRQVPCSTIVLFRPRSKS